MGDQEDKSMRAGETALHFCPSERADASVTFIGHLETPWSRGNCPKNLRAAREEKGKFLVHLAEPYRAGLIGLDVGQPVILLYWMHEARRDLIQQKPRHVDGTRGTFSLRSPVRPNSISLASVIITSLDQAAGRVEVDALDCFNGTPLLDIKPWLPTIDQPPQSCG